MSRLHWLFICFCNIYTIQHGLVASVPESFRNFSENVLVPQHPTSYTIQYISQRLIRRRKAFLFIRCLNKFESFRAIQQTLSFVKLPMRRRIWPPIARSTVINETTITESQHTCPIICFSLERQKNRRFRLSPVFQTCLQSFISVAALLIRCSLRLWRQLQTIYAATQTTFKALRFEGCK